eukprot:s1582_g5.t1
MPDASKVPRRISGTPGWTAHTAQMGPTCAEHPCHVKYYTILHSFTNFTFCFCTTATLSSNSDVVSTQGSTRASSKVQAVGSPYHQSEHAAGENTSSQGWRLAQVSLTNARCATLAAPCGLTVHQQAAQDSITKADQRWKVYEVRHYTTSLNPLAFLISWTQTTTTAGLAATPTTNQVWLVCNIQLG